MNRRGVIDPVSLTIIAILGICLLFPSFHLPAFLQRKPPVAQLTKAQTDLDATKKQLAAAQATLDAAKAAEAQKTRDQTAYAQQMVAGVPVALQRAPQTPEVVLASRLAQRAQVGLAAAIGDLPADKQAEITAIVGQALSAKQDEVDAANAALKAKDSALNDAISAKTALERQIPTLQATVTTLKAQSTVQEATVATKTAEVAAYAEKKSQADQKAGSWEAYAMIAFRIILIIAILYIFCHYVLPCLAAEFPAATWLTNLYRGLTSLISAHTVSVPTATPPVTTSTITTASTPASK